MNKRFLFSFIIAVSIGFIGGFFVFHKNEIQNTSSETCEMQFSYINKKLGCRSKTVVKKHEYTSLFAELHQYINRELEVNNVQLVSVYFRDLQYGPTFGINEQEKFAPASLLKVPTLMTFLALAEKDSGILSRKVSYNNLIALVEQEQDTIPQLKPNTPYSIDELLSRMIIYSDNVSYWVLKNYLTQRLDDIYTETMIELGLVNPRTPNEDVITVKSYASLFRHLYNSSYLSPEMSEKALELLAKSEYTKGLVAGVPQGIKVAHKFGERSGLPNGEKQLHDCGIIYYPNNPYLLCIMTRGDNFDELARIIKTISENVYQEVGSRKY